MKFLILFLLSGSLFAANGFNLEINPEGSYYAHDIKDILEAPVCNAIKNQKQIEVLVDVKEKLNKREIRITTKKIVIDPYLLGVSKEGWIVLRGNVASEKMLKEVSIKFGEDKFDDSSWQPQPSGHLNGRLNDNAIVEKIVNVYVLQNSHFDVPRNYKSQKDKVSQVLCEVGSNNQAGH